MKMYSKPWNGTKPAMPTRIERDHDSFVANRAAIGYPTAKRTMYAELKNPRR